MRCRGARSRRWPVIESGVAFAAFVMILHLNRRQERALAAATQQLRTDAQTRHEAALVVDVQGRLDSTTSSRLEQELLSRITTDERCIVLDCSQLAYVTSAGLRAVLLAARKLENSRATGSPRAAEAAIAASRSLCVRNARGPGSCCAGVQQGKLGGGLESASHGGGEVRSPRRPAEKPYSKPGGAVHFCTWRLRRIPALCGRR